LCPAAARFVDNNAPDGSSYVYEVGAWSSAGRGPRTASNVLDLRGPPNKGGGIVPKGPVVAPRGLQTPPN
jgi:hypothetical protein